MGIVPHHCLWGPIKNKKGTMMSIVKGKGEKVQFEFRKNAKGPSFHSLKSIDSLILSNLENIIF